MKLTPKQKEIIDKAIELEHGPVADEVFIRFVNTDMDTALFSIKKEADTLMQPLSMASIQ